MIDGGSLDVEYFWDLHNRASRGNRCAVRKAVGLGEQLVD